MAYIVFESIGINAKMSELHAAMGLSVFKYIDEIISKRTIAVARYRNLLSNANVELLKIRPNTEWNSHYFPVIFPSEAALLKCIHVFNNNGINPRRYYYPSLNNLNYVEKASMTISDDLSSRIICLPLSHDITEETQQKITNILIDHI